MERRRIASIYDRRIRTSLVPEVANIFQYYQRAIIIAIVIIFFDFVKFRHDRYLSSSIFEISSNRVLGWICRRCFCHQFVSLLRQYPQEMLLQKWGAIRT